MGCLCDNIVCFVCCDRCGGGGKGGCESGVIMCSALGVSSSFVVAGNSSMVDSTVKLGAEGGCTLGLVLYLCIIGFFVCLWDMILLEGVYVLIGVSTLGGESFSTLGGRVTSLKILASCFKAEM